MRRNATGSDHAHRHPDHGHPDHGHHRDGHFGDGPDDQDGD
jgi:hypothetical protein